MFSYFRSRTVTSRFSAVTAVAVGVLFFALQPTSAQAAPTPVTTYAQLSTAVAAGKNVTLGADITDSGDTLAVSSTKSVSIDLNGHNLSLTGAAGGAAIDDPSGGRLAINDLVGGGSLHATGGSGSAGIRVSTGATLILHARSIDATGGSGGAGIGGSAGQDGGSVKVVLGSVVNAKGGTGAAGIGGGSGGNGGDVQVDGGQVTATGGAGGAGIGGGSGGDGGTLGVNQSSFVVAQGGSGAAGVGAGTGGGAGSGSVKIATRATLEAGNGSGASAITLGSLTNAGILRIPVGSDLHVPSGVTAENTGLIRVLGSITGTGTIHNAGTILNTQGQLVADTGQGPAGSALLITDHNYTVKFSLDGSPGTPPTTLNVYAADIAKSKQGLPPVPTTPGLTCTAGWFTSATGGTQVTNTTTLSTVAAYGPSTLVLHRHCTTTASSTPASSTPASSTPASSGSSGGSTTGIVTTSSTLANTGATTGSQVGLALLLLLGGLGLAYAGRSRTIARHSRRH